MTTSNVECFVGIDVSQAMLEVATLPVAERWTVAQEPTAIDTLATIRVNPLIRPFHERRRQAGKAPKVAITACMRKLLTILNAMAKNHTPWQVEFLQQFSALRKNQ